MNMCCIIQNIGISENTGIQGRLWNALLNRNKSMQNSLF